MCGRHDSVSKRNSRQSKVVMRLPHLETRVPHQELAQTTKLPATSMRQRQKAR